MWSMGAQLAPSLRTQCLQQFEILTIHFALVSLRHSVSKSMNGAPASIIRPEVNVEGPGGRLTQSEAVIGGLC